MSRYTGPKCRLCRREGVKLFLKGVRCESGKCALTRRQQTPGVHGNVRQRPSIYRDQLREKQRVKRTYGVLERQFRRYFREAQESPGIVGTELLVLLERRLDNVVYRLNLAASRAQARQLAVQAKINVNGKVVDRPSYSVAVGDQIARVGVSKPVREADLPGWLSWSRTSRQGEVKRWPRREDIDPEIKEELIVEFYSR